MRPPAGSHRASGQRGSLVGKGAHSDGNLLLLRGGSCRGAERQGRGREKRERDSCTREREMPHIIDYGSAVREESEKRRRRELRATPTAKRRERDGERNADVRNPVRSPLRARRRPTPRVIFCDRLFIIDVLSCAANLTRFLFSRHLAKMPTFAGHVRPRPPAR